MIEKWYKKDNKIILEIPVWSKRSNPYMEGEDVGEFQTLIGIICKDKSGNDELGFAEQIDMDYKDKGDQWTDIKYQFWSDKEDFIKLCKELEITYFEYPTCTYCGQSIYGSFTDGDKGNQCFECETKEDKIWRKIWKWWISPVKSKRVKRTIK